MNRQNRTESGHSESQTPKRRAKDRVEKARAPLRKSSDSGELSSLRHSAQQLSRWVETELLMQTDGILSAKRADLESLASTLVASQKTIKAVKTKADERFAGLRESLQELETDMRSISDQLDEAAMITERGGDKRSSNRSCIQSSLRSLEEKYLRAVEGAEGRQQALRGAALSLEERATSMRREVQEVMGEVRGFKENASSQIQRMKDGVKNLQEEFELVRSERKTALAYLKDEAKRLKEVLEEGEISREREKADIQEWNSQISSILLKSQQDQRKFRTEFMGRIF